MDLDMSVSHPYQCDECQFSSNAQKHITEHKWRAHPIARASTRRMGQKRPYSPPKAAQPQSHTKKHHKPLSNLQVLRYSYILQYDQWFYQLVLCC